MTSATPEMRSAAASCSAAVAVEADDVRFVYPRPVLKRRRSKSADRTSRHALEGVSLRIAAGESVALLGPNGSGKSTLLKILATMLRPDSGTVQIFGRRDRAAIRRALGVVFQSPGLDAQMSVEENLRDSARLYGLSNVEAKHAVDEALQGAGIHDRRHDRVRTLSGGLARRADLCRALLHDPKLLLLDEPTTGLDPTARRGFLEQVEQRRAETRLTVLMTTHLTEEAQQFDRVLLLHEGAIVANDTPKNLQQQAGAARFTVHDPRWSPPETDGNAWQRTPDGWRMVVSKDMADVQQLAAQLADRRAPFTFSPPTLADVFEQLTGTSLDENNA